MNWIYISVIGYILANAFLSRNYLIDRQRYYGKLDNLDIVYGLVLLAFGLPITIGLMIFAVVAIKIQGENMKW